MEPITGEIAKKNLSIWLKALDDLPHRSLYRTQFLDLNVFWRDTFSAVKTPNAQIPFMFVNFTSRSLSRWLQISLSNEIY
jgi:hypothetical protein